MRLLGVAAAAALVAGCGGGSGWSDAACRREAGWIAERAQSMVRHYGGVSVYPADMSYLGFKGSLDRFQAGACRVGTLGQALAGSLSPRERSMLVELLPAGSAEAVRQALTSH